MNPSTGSFITMDEYAGSIFEPVSLHKYLYANANPVTYSDPTGYFSTVDFAVANSISQTLNKMYISNGVAMLNGAMNSLIAALSGATPEQVQQAFTQGFFNGFMMAGGYAALAQLAGCIPFLKILVATFDAYTAFGDLQMAKQAKEEGDYLAAAYYGLIGIIGLFYAGKTAAQACFAGETFVATEDGQKRIDEIKVWAYNVETGETELKKVTTVYVHEVEEILHLSTTEGDIDTTTNHPFYVIDKGWVAAGDLEEGDEVYNLDGSTAVIIDSELEKLDDSLLVYNLEIEDFHTYFVGYEPVLVHNSCSDSYHGNSSKSTKKQHGYEIIESDTGKVVKTGISGGDLNINGSSKRANSQVNNWNKAEGNGKYEANVVKTDMPDRATALQWEKNNA